MKKLLCVIFVIFALVGCYWTEMECFSYKKFMEVNLITTSKVDSVDFFLDGRHVCHMDSALVFVKDSASGLFFLGKGIWRGFSDVVCFSLLFGTVQRQNKRVVRSFGYVYF